MHLLHPFLYGYLNGVGPQGIRLNGFLPEQIDHGDI